MRKFKKILSILIITAVAVQMTACYSVSQYKHAIDYLRSGDLTELVSRVRNALDNIEYVGEYTFDFFEDLREAVTGKPGHAKDDSSDESSLDESTEESGTKEDGAGKAGVKDSAEDSGSQIEVPVNNKAFVSVLPEYEHYDQADFDILADGFSAAVEAGDAEKAEEYYFQMADALKHIYTMDAVAGINFSKNVTDEEADEESVYSDELMLNCADQFYTLCLDALNSDIEEDFRGFAHEVVIKDSEEYEPMTDEQKELIRRESELSNKYETMYYDLDSLSYSYDGKDYLFSDLYAEDSPLSGLYYRDQDGYFEVYSGLLKAANDLFGPLFLELLDIRLDIAESYGYDNYSDYAYTEVYFRDYTAEEAQAFCDTVKRTAAEKYADEVYPYTSYQYYTDTTFSEEEILSAIDVFTRELDPGLNEAFNEMVSAGLYDYGNDPSRSEGNYTTIIPEIERPFVFVTGDGNQWTFSSFTHEFGHFADFYYEFSTDPEVFFRSDNLDIAEICSNGLQLMMSNKYSEAMKKRDAYAGKTSNVENMYSQIIEGCLFDEFQRRIYEDAEGLTIDDINDIFSDVLAEYNMDEMYDPYMWVLIPHTFQSPLYYFSYAVSALSSLEIWNISVESEEDAYKAWRDVVELAQDTPYLEAFEDLPLTPFTDSEGVERICLETIDNLNAIQK